MGGAVKRFAPNSEHVVRVECDGYSPVERRVTLTVDTSMAIDLNVEPSPSAVPQVDEPRGKRRNVSTNYHPRAAPSGVAPAANSGKPSSVSCSPPYYFVGGIKTFKPECI